ncbi:hypothetical protein [Enterovibrio norvegicus]|uniref:hypothetical protein n=1 Tax=Enterovibrio norvegicus TaxID=188144 RepID=UPI00354EFB3F
MERGDRLIIKVRYVDMGILFEIRALKCKAAQKMRRCNMKEERNAKLTLDNMRMTVQSSNILTINQFSHVICLPYNHQISNLKLKWK